MEGCFIAYVHRYFVVLLFGVYIAFCAFTSDPDVSVLNTPVALPKRSTFLTAEEINKLDSVDIAYQFRGNCYAFSSAKNETPTNGAGRSSNVARPVDSTFATAGFYLVVNPAEYVKIGESFLGCRLYLVNTTDTARNLNAQDSRLSIVAEALNSNNEWVPISYLPSSWCGNSYHVVTLGANEYWGFTVPIFKGTYTTKMRYVLQTKKQILYSNEVLVHINRDQMDPNKKQGYTSGNIMDPYDD